MKNPLYDRIIEIYLKREGHVEKNYYREEYIRDKIHDTRPLQFEKVSYFLNLSFSNRSTWIQIQINISLNDKLEDMKCILVDMIGAATIITTFCVNSRSACTILHTNGDTLIQYISSIHFYQNILISTIYSP